MFNNIRILLCFGTSYGMMLVALLLVFYLIFGNIQRGSTNILSEKLNVKESISSEGRLLWLLVVKIRLCFGEKLRKLSALPLLVTPRVLWWIHGLSADSDVSENFRSKLADLLNNSEDANACQDQLDKFRVNLSLSHHVITDVFITEEVVEESLLKLGRDKSDGTSVSLSQIISYLLPLILLHFSHISLHLFSVMATCLKHYVIAS